MKKSLIFADSSGTVTKIIMPVDLDFRPQEDITTFELAQCLPFLLEINMILPYQFDKEAGYARHWTVSDPN